MTGRQLNRAFEGEAVRRVRGRHVAVALAAGHEAAASVQHHWLPELAATSAAAYAGTRRGSDLTPAGLMP